MPAVEVDAEELASLRCLARRALELSEMIGDGRLVERRARRPRPDSDRFTHQELNLVQRLVEARGETVPHDRLIRHVCTTERHATTDEWNRNPATTVCFARRKLRTRFGRECIETVWSLRTNSKGRVVRDTKAGIRGYAWTGPDIQGMAIEAARELGLVAEDN